MGATDDVGRAFLKHAGCANSLHDSGSSKDGDQRSEQTRAFGFGANADAKIILNSWLTEVPDQYRACA